MPCNIHTPLFVDQTAGPHLSMVAHSGRHRRERERTERDKRRWGCAAVAGEVVAGVGGEAVAAGAWGGEVVAVAGKKRRRVEEMFEDLGRMGELLGSDV
ncbi:hypothetical protein HanIR_Chr05g0234141 [Helianthus annuus]|nr:hypothetical protein HanIR_Chr05g0234141 [Helianthus annuus]